MEEATTEVSIGVRLCVCVGARPLIISVGIMHIS